MRVIVTDKDTLRHIPPQKVASYLLSRKWHKKFEQERIVSVWTKNGAEIALPLDQDFADYTLRVSELLKLLEESENRSQLEILKDLYAVYSDVIRIRAESPSYEDGTIPLTKGVELINQAQSLITASANATIRKQAFYRGKSPDTVREYLEEVRLGQTEQGSFVATFYSPLPVNTPTFPFISVEPYERQVTKNLVHSLNTVQIVAEEYFRNEKLGCFKEAIEDGVNGNLCEAIVGIASAAPLRDVEVSVSWAPVMSSDMLGIVVIPQRIIPAVVKAVEYYKYLNIPEEITVEGYVIGLSKEKAKQMAEGTVRVLAIIDGSPRRIRINLSESSHHLAVHAYEEGTKVICSGKLIKEGKFWRLDTPSELKLEQELGD